MDLAAAPYSRCGRGARVRALSSIMPAAADMTPFCRDICRPARARFSYRELTVMADLYMDYSCFEPV